MDPPGGSQGGGNDPDGPRCPRGRPAHSRTACGPSQREGRCTDTELEGRGLGGTEGGIELGMVPRRAGDGPRPRLLRAQRGTGGHVRHDGSRSPRGHRRPKPSRTVWRRSPSRRRRELRSHSCSCFVGEGAPEMLDEVERSDHDGGLPLEDTSEFTPWNDVADITTILSSTGTPFRRSSSSCSLRSAITARTSSRISSPRSSRRSPPIISP